jgi:hypothetical protein
MTAAEGLEGRCWQLQRRRWREGPGTVRDGSGLSCVHSISWITTQFSLKLSYTSTVWHYSLAGVAGNNAIIWTTKAALDECFD